jgi:hypothetical protein
MSIDSVVFPRRVPLVLSVHVARLPATGEPGRTHPWMRGVFRIIG